MQVSKAESGKVTVPFGFFDTEGSDMYRDPLKTRTVLIGAKGILRHELGKPLRSNGRCGERRVGRWRVMKNSHG
jgi:hypothetical protein